MARSRLLQNFVSLAKSSAKEQMLTAILLKTLDLTAELTRAETGSLFLLDPGEKASRSRRNSCPASFRA